ncbi:MAG: hypothetical protein MJZ37_08610 [Bacilli bacterium]|nr:hypothetical protein [Bacilli bacterium]
MFRCDKCRHQNSCVCVPYGCESFEFDLSKYNAKVRADVIDELEQKLRVWDNKANAIPAESVNFIMNRFMRKE